MFTRLTLCSAFFIGCACAAQTPIPNTPAGRTLRAWFDAFNSGDRLQMAAFVQKYQRKVSVDKMIEFRVATGSLELLAIDTIDPTHIKFRAQQKANSKTAIGELDLTDGSPAQIVNLNFMGLQDLAPGVTQPR